MAACHRTFPELFDIDRKHVRLEIVLQVARRESGDCFGLESAWINGRMGPGGGLEASSLFSAIPFLGGSHQSITDSESETRSHLSCFRCQNFIAAWVYQGDAMV